MPPHYPYAAPPPKKRKVWLWVLLGVLGLVLVCCIGGIIATTSKNDDNTSSPNNQNDRSAQQPSAEPSIGMPVRDGKFEFVVHKVQCGVNQIGTGGLGEKAQGQFRLVTMSVKNIGDEPQTLFDSNQKGFGNNGVRYNTDSTAGLYANESNNQVWLTEINPGNQVTGVMVFDIPRDAQLTHLELHDSAFSGGVKVKLQ